ncbi:MULTISPECIES: type II toxin-antitoxin system Phd/YefM family antitoxin [Pantoea]|jgi:antitoxin Phd|uniref:type II toxin-antitoxin system Phd/YefM family antitoxin n=1 Tax=Pantoea TaxID=53335 RepID=UPI00080F3A2F|nr:MULTISPECIES: type II toxin-antitoxin system Phd/YefM family antitoxin [Pantoea]MDJ0021704.1 type II toxin-antitoxin system Phd/YefM family antitoxin [Pantoea eucrina]ORM77955.1 hypothetical protein HA43_09850 [Pantoea eucrina]RBO11717.1 type II toxin-antitoxin system Phd/YefM family antitoxin [Pantoea sp. 3_1284]
MNTVNSRAARDTWAATLDAALVEPIEVTRNGGKESVVMLSKSEFESLKRIQLEKDMDYILDRHANTFKALADR